MADREPVNLFEYEEAARAVLPKSQFDFIARGAEDEVTLRSNREGYARWRLLPRVLTGVGAPSLRTTVLGTEVSLPVLISPMGLHALAHERGEIATATAAQRAGTIFTLGVAAGHTIEDVATVAGAWWFQIYLMKDRGRSAEHIRRAEAAGASAIVFTVDVPVRGNRESDTRNQFDLPAGSNMPNVAFEHLPDDAHRYSALAAWDRDISWTDLDWMRRLTDLPILIKGVLAPDDAKLAIEHGAAGLIVSNHGGRQLDSSIASIDALPAVVEAVGGRAEVLIDGGVRRGTDVIKALALGANAVMIGRPVMFGLAVAQEEGVLRVLDLLRQELASDLVLCGIDDVRRVPRELAVPNAPLCRT